MTRMPENENLFCDKCRQDLGAVDITAEDGQPMTVELYMAFLHAAGNQLLCEDCIAGRNVPSRAGLRGLRHA
jgi:hypothetical protein